MRKLAILFLAILTVVFFASCQRETVEKPANTSQNPNLTVTHTIAQLLEFHPITTGFTYDSLPQGIVIQGIVISSDEEGNCYHYLTIDDGTAGIQIKINKNRLYQDYPVGQHIYVKCDGLVLGDYGKLYQLGW